MPLICETKQPLLLCEFFQVAKLTCLHFLLEHDVDIILTYPRVVEHKRQELQEDPFADIAKYIEKNHRFIFGSLPTLDAFEENLKRHLEQYRESFFSLLRVHIEHKQTTEVALYKKANIDRRLFSKIRSNADYVPSKNTVLSLAIALELDMDETQALLQYAGYSLSALSKSDTVIGYFIEHQDYDIEKINMALFHFTGDTLTGVEYRDVKKS